MAKKSIFAKSMSDAGFNIGASLLAASSACFAIYAIALAPPPKSNSGQLQQPQILASTLQTSSDPIVTGSTERAGYPTAHKPEFALDISTHSTLDSKRQYFKFREFRSDGAMVDLKDDEVSYSMAIKPGYDVPGLGLVLKIENYNGNWYVITNKGRYGEEGFISKTRKFDQ
jgi:hypothetical protein